MKKTTLLLIVLLLPVVFVSAVEEKIVTQSSTVNAVLNGLYDGEMTFGELKNYGDFGIGYFHKMGGEALALDGIFYRIKSDGLTEIVQDSDTTPFFTVTAFQSNSDNYTNRNFNFNELKDYLRTMMPRKKSFYAIKITGVFDSLSARTFLSQVKPYPPVDQVLKSQTVFNFTNTEGVLIGFYSPEFMEGINIPGFHFHYISKDKARGGHVSSLTVNSITIEIIELPSLRVILPKNQEYQDSDLTMTKSMKRDLDKFEKE